MSDDTNSGVVSGGSTAPDSSKSGYISKMLEKAVESGQLPDRNVGTTVGGGLSPPYDPYHLAGLMESSGTHAACITKKARRESGFGFELVPYGDITEEEASDEEYERAYEFWFGSDTKWKLGPTATGTAHATPDEVFEKAAQDHHAIGWDAVEILYSGADLEPQGLAYIPAKSIRQRKGEDGGVGHGYVQERDGRTVYLAEAGDRHVDEDDPNGEEVYVDKYSGDIYRGSGADLPADFEPANEILFYPNWHPNATNGYGIPTWISEVQTILNDNEARRFNGQRLKNDLMMDYVVIVEGGQLTEWARDNLEGWFDEMRESDEPELLYLEAEELAEKVNLNGDGDGNDVSIRIEPAQHFNDEDESFGAYRERNMRDIARAHEVPLAALGEHDATNTNTREALRELDEEVIGPNQSRREERIYRTIHQQILDVHDWKLSFKKGEIRDEVKEAEIAATIVDAVGDALTAGQAIELFPVELEADETVDEMLLSEIGGDDGLAMALQDEISDQVDDGVNRVMVARRIDAGAQAEADD